MAEELSVRQRILQEATCHFVEQGYAGASMHAIAASAGISKPGLYYHFRDKEALFLAILLENVEAMGEIVEGAQRGEATVRGQVQRILEAIFAQAPAQRAIIRLASQELGRLNPGDQAEFGKLYHGRFIGQLGTMLRAGMERGELRPMDPELATWMLLGMAYPFLHQGREQPAGRLEEALALMMRIFFDGAGAPAVTAP
jgi:AcrR family transcriptional regulator